MRPILFSVAGFDVPSFWVMAFFGFFVAFLLVRSEVLRRGYPLASAYDITLYAYVGGWVGARLFIIPTGWDYFVEDPIAFLLSSSGWVWYGGVIGGTAALVYWARRQKFPVLVLADVAAPPLAAGLGIGRIGCQLSGDGDYGIASNLPWAMSYPEGVVPTTDLVHPVPVYEMIGCFILFAYLWQRRRNAPPGDLFGRYLIASGVLRFFLEFVRRNPAWIVGLTTAQWMSVGAAAVGVLFLRAARARRE